MMQDFLQKYDAIIASGSKQDMERLGAMVKRVMRWLCTYEPMVAQQALAILDNEECRNKLTENEAKRIVDSMKPAPAWSPDHLLDMVRRSGRETEEKPYFNKWALAAVMCMILSDSGDTLRRFVGQPGHPVSQEEMLAVVYQLATDKLKDEDGRFDVRKYFGLN